MFQTFRELRDSKKGKAKEHGSEFLRRRPWAKVEGQKANQVEKGTLHAARFPGRVRDPLFAPVAPMPSIFLLPSVSWPKNDYIKGPLAFSRRRRHGETKPRNRETEGCRRRRSEGGNAAGITPGGLHPPPACSSSTSTARSAPSLHCNLLANTMYDAILYSLDILCLPVYVWVVNCSWQWWNSSLIGCIQVCYLLWLSLCTIYECTHMLGNACKVITGSIMEWWWLGSDSNLRPSHKVKLLGDIYRGP